MQHTPMTGSELFGSKLSQLFASVAMMQHEHAWAAPETMEAKPWERSFSISVHDGSIKGARYG